MNVDSQGKTVIGILLDVQYSQMVGTKEIFETISYVKTHKQIKYLSRDLGLHMKKIKYLDKEL
jgi:hypothetical protein